MSEPDYDRELDRQQVKWERRTYGDGKRYGNTPENFYRNPHAWWRKKWQKKTDVNVEEICSKCEKPILEGQGRYRFGGGYLVHCEACGENIDSSNWII